MPEAPGQQPVADADLVERALAGDRSAYAELVRRWAGRVLAMCHARIRCRHAAEDLAQETLLRGYRELGALRDPQRFGSWLGGIAHRVCLDWLKAKQNSQVPFSTLRGESGGESFLAGDDGSATGPVETADETERLMNEVEALPAELREVLMLYYYHDTTYQELADLLGVSAATINARLTKARAELRRRLRVCGGN